MERDMRVYRITSPSGKCYIGITKNTLKKRIEGHLRRANRGDNHPFYNAIRKYGFENFKVEEAKEREVFYIAEYKEKTGVYNISRGGDYDGLDGMRHFWNTLTPERREVYIENLKRGISASDLRDYDRLQECSQKWRKENPKAAYKISSRNLRLAQRAIGIKPYFEREASKPQRLKRPLSVGHHIGAKKQWASRTEEERKTVGRNISKALKARNSCRAETEKAKHDAQLAEARKNIDVRKRSQRVREAYAELKKDPVKWAEYLEKRRKSRESKGV